MAAYPKRRAAAIAEELTRQELEQDAGNEQDSVFSRPMSCPIGNVK